MLEVSGIKFDEKFHFSFLFFPKDINLGVLKSIVCAGVRVCACECVSVCECGGMCGG